MTWALWRLLKYVGLSLLVGGMAAVAARPTRGARLRAAYQGVVPGFMVTWIGGYGVLKVMDAAMDGWVLVSLLMSLISLHLVLLLAHGVRRPRLVHALGWGALGSTLGEMVLRPATTPDHLAALAVGLVIAGGVWLMSTVTAASDDEATETFVHTAVLWIGRIEASSLLLLLVVAIGRRAADVDLGVWPAIIGWTHGVLIFVWLQVLIVAGRALGWSIGLRVIGAVSGVIPFGTLIFERWTPEPVASPATTTSSVRSNIRQA